ncbi:MAG: CPBP family intramembrane metalloprotease [Phycisphaeraceae bacterium]|nr:CPBP family intramembrane metalloprotease [Phycisphaeraceae bacterium]
MSEDSGNASGASSIEPARGFCGVCGAALATGTCARCERVKEVKEHQEAERRVEGRPMAVCLWLYGLLLGMSLIGSIALAFEKGDAWKLIVEGGIESVDAIIVLGFLFFAGREAAEGLRFRSGERQPWWWMWFPGAAAAGVLTFGAAWIATGAFNQVAGGRAYEYAAAARSLGFGWWLVVLMTAVQPAVIEELAFRGIIQPNMAKLTGPTAAIFVSAAMFMVLHLNVPSFPHLLLIGVVLGAFRRWSGSVYPGMLLHFVHNGFVILLEWKGI